MKNQKEIKKALKGDRPINSLFALIPKSRKKEFLSFAEKFGYSEDKVKSILGSEK